MKREDWISIGCVGAVFLSAVAFLFAPVLGPRDPKIVGELAINLVSAAATVAAVFAALFVAGKADRREHGRNSAHAHIAAFRLLPKLEVLRHQTFRFSFEINLTGFTWPMRYEWAHKTLLDGSLITDEALTFEDQDLIAVAWLLPELPHDLMRTIGDLRLLKERITALNPHKFGDGSPEGKWPRDVFEDYRQRFSSARDVVERLSKDVARLVATKTADR